jgi:hypothetical protein
LPSYSDGVRLLCGAFADSLEYVRKATGCELSEAEVVDVRKTLVHRLAMDHDFGEREPDALKRAALREVFASNARALSDSLRFTRRIRPNENGRRVAPIILTQPISAIKPVATKLAL